MSNVQGIDESTAKDIVKELREEQLAAQKKKAEAEVGLSELYKDKTTGKFKLPLLKMKGIALLESVQLAYEGKTVGQMESFFMMLWVLENQDNPESFDLDAAELRAQVLGVGDRFELDEMDDLGKALDEAFGVMDKMQEEPEGNQPAPAKKKPSRRKQRKQ